MTAPIGSATTIWSLRTSRIWEGNQQKVIIAKWVQRDCNIIIFDEPTRGIDVGAKKEVYSVIKKLADAGTSVLKLRRHIVADTAA